MAQIHAVNVDCPLEVELKKSKQLPSFFVLDGFVIEDQFDLHLYVHIPTATHFHEVVGLWELVLVQVEIVAFN